MANEVDVLSYIFTYLELLVQSYVHFVIVSATAPLFEDLVKEVMAVPSI